MSKRALEMTKITVTVQVPVGIYCDICTPERLEEHYQKGYSGDMKCVCNRVAGRWEYRCSFAYGDGGKNRCALFNNVHLEKAEYIPRDPIAHRLLKCKNCRAESGAENAPTGAESE